MWDLPRPGLEPVSPALAGILLLFFYVESDPFFFFLPIFNFIFIYLFLVALGLHCCVWAFSTCGKRGLLFVVVRRLLVAVAFLVVEVQSMGSRHVGFNSCGT